MKIDPRTRILLIVCLSTLAVLALDIVYLSAVFAGALAVNLVLRTDIIGALKRMRHLISLIIFISIVQSLTVKGGAPLVHFNGIAIVSTKGLQYGGEFALRMGVIMLCSLLALSAGGREMIDGLIMLKVPYEIAFMASITLRFLPVFRDEFANRLNALRLRGIDIKRAGLRKKLRIYSYLLAPAVSGSLIRSRELAESIESRAFRAYNKRSMLREPILKAVDYFVIILTLLISCVFAVYMYKKGAFL